MQRAMPRPLVLQVWPSDWPVARPTATLPGGTPNVATYVGHAQGMHAVSSELGKNSAVDAAMDATGMSMSEIYQAMHSGSVVSADAI